MRAGRRRSGGGRALVGEDLPPVRRAAPKARTAADAAFLVEGAGHEPGVVGDCLAAEIRDLPSFGHGPAMAFARAAGLNVPGYAGGTMPAMPVGDLIKSGGFGFLWIEKLDQAGKRLVATVLSVGRSVARVAAESQQFVSKQIAAAVAPQITSVTGLRGELGRDTSRATSASCSRSS